MHATQGQQSSKLLLRQQGRTLENRLHRKSDTFIGSGSVRNVHHGLLGSSSRRLGGGSRPHTRQPCPPLSAAETPRWSGIVPDVPFTGDDQGSTIYTALAQLHELGNFDESQFEADTYAREATGKPANGAAAPSDHSLASTTETATDAAPVATSPGAPPPEKGIPHRWQVVGMMALSFVLCNMDKVNMSVAVIPMAKELGWSATERGLVSSSFFWGYSLTQIPAGWVSTSIGGSRVLLAGVALWSLGTLIAPPAAKLSLIALCATRVFVGLGEGLAPSSATNVMARLVPE